MKQHGKQEGDGAGLLRAVLAALSLAVGLGVAFLVPVEAAPEFVRHGGYLFVFVACACFGFYLWRSLRGGRPWRSYSREKLVGVAAMLLGGWLLFVHADFGPKIAMDDYILASTARNLHESREVRTTLRVEPEGERFAPAETRVDKRPWLYPFLVSVLHDVAGYRPAHPFVLNAALGIGGLALGFAFGYGLAGLAGGVLAVFLWVSLPLLAQNATGGGMELLNLFLLQLVLVLGFRYLREPGRAREGAFALAGLLLFYSRYESALFLVPVAAVIVLGWLRAGRAFLSGGTLLVPPLMVAGLLQLRRYFGEPASWELTGGAESAFALRHIAENLPHALAFFFSYDDTLANSLLLSGAGLAGVFIFLLLLRTEWGRYWRERPAAVVLAVFAPVFVAHLALVLGFHAGRLDSPFVSRYALPVHCLLIFAPVVVLEYFGRARPRVWSWAAGVTGVFLLAFTLPMNAKAIFSKRNFAIREQAWLERLSGREIRSQSLVIDRFTVPWALRDWPSRPPHQVAGKATELIRAVRMGRYPEVYFVERNHYADGRFVPHTPFAEELHDAFEMKRVAERSFRPFSLTRIYKIEASRASEGGAD
ncbi:MAG: hypothetical protein ACLFS4_06730 [Opitutales bacterium]